VVPWLFLYGVGLGLATAQLTGVVLKDVPVRLSGQGSGTQSTARQIGSALGIAVLGTVLFTATGAALDARLADMPTLPESARTQIVDTVVVSAGSAIPALAGRDPAVGAAASESFSDGTRASAFAGAGFLALGLLATLRVGSGSRREDDGSDADAETDAGADATQGG
jgi:hypothetical protein